MTNVNLLPSIIYITASNEVVSLNASRYGNRNWRRH